MKTIHNPVAKHARTYNKSTIQVDRKKAARKGYQKHKKPGASGLFSGRRVPSWSRPDVLNAPLHHSLGPSPATRPSDSDPRGRGSWPVSLD